MVLLWLFPTFAAKIIASAGVSFRIEFVIHIKTKSKEKVMTEERFKVLWHDEYAKMYRVAYSMLREAEASKDVVSQAFADLLERDTHSLADDDMARYLYRMVCNRCLDLRRRLDVEQRFRIQYSQEPHPEVPDYLERELLLTDIREFVDTQMSQQSSRAVRLCYDKGLTHQQAADAMQISLSALNKNLARGLEAIRKRFKNK